MARVMVKAGLILPVALTLLFFSACRKPAHLDGISAAVETEPRVSSVSLKDTLPASLVASLELSNVVGIQFMHSPGQFSRYFEYDTDKQAILKAISKLPFSKYGAISDTNCRKIGPLEFRRQQSIVSVAERNQADFFWDVDADQYDVYECIKTPIRHLLLISKSSNRIIHRIASAG